jgi:DNA-binding NarL/FixJ family response regulator
MSAARISSPQWIDAGARKDTALACSRFSASKVGLTAQRLRRFAASMRSVKRILIVDDHGGFRTAASRVLEAGGFDVVGEAADGAQALDAVARLHPDAVLLDVQLPDIDGFEVAHRLRANGHSPTVVLTSSRDAIEFGSLVARSGARGFIPKADLSGSRLAALLA